MVLYSVLLKLVIGIRYSNVASSHYPDSNIHANAILQTPFPVFTRK